MLSAGERHHGEAVREGQKLAAGFVRRVGAGNEIDVIEREAPDGRARDSKMTQVNGIESAAEKGDAPAFSLLGELGVNAPPRGRVNRLVPSVSSRPAVSAEWRLRVEGRRRGTADIERVGHSAHQFGDAFAGGRGDSVKLETLCGAVRARAVQAFVVGGGVEFGGHHDHGFIRQRRAEGRQLAADNLEVVHWIAVRCGAGVHQVRDQARALDVLQKAHAQPGTFVRAFNQPG